MGYKPSADLPDKIPDHPEAQRAAVALGALTMITVVFLALVGQGCPPREAVTVTIALGMGGAETARRLVHHRDQHSGGRR